MFTQLVIFYWMAHQIFDLSRVLSATGLAFLAMVGMIIGVLLGIYARPSQRTTAIVMAFGTGALIHAVAIDLAFEGSHRLVETMNYTGSLAWSFVSGAFLLGGIMYYLGNKALEEKGASIRHPALAKFYFLKEKRNEKARILQQLYNVELLRSLPPQDMEIVLDSIKTRHYPKGEFIFLKGDPADGLYLITEGQVNIVDDRSSLGKVIAKLKPGESFGEMALLTGEPRYATAFAATDVTVLKIGKERFNTLIKSSYFLRKSLEQLNSARISENVQRMEPMDKQHWMNIALSNIERLSKTEEYSLMQKHAKKGAPFAIFLGAMMDLIPESIVIGAGFVDFKSYSYTFLAAVFMANLPEAMASSQSMMMAGFTKYKIFRLWFILILAGVVAAALGNMFLLTASPVIISLVEALAGGAILAMVASVMMPEAYEDGGSEVGLATIAGFVVAFFFTLY